MLPLFPSSLSLSLSLFGPRLLDIPFSIPPNSLARMELKRQDLGWWSVVKLMGQGSCSQRMATHVEPEKGFGPLSYLTFDNKAKGRLSPLMKDSFNSMVCGVQCLGWRENLLEGLRLGDTAGNVVTPTINVDKDKLVIVYIRHSPVWWHWQHILIYTLNERSKWSFPSASQPTGGICCTWLLYTSSSQSQSTVGLMYLHSSHFISKKAQSLKGIVMDEQLLQAIVNI
ncbi:hypothetical protein V8E52_003269 [Russula decolorans]